MTSILGTCADSKAFVKGPEVCGTLGRRGWLGLQVESKEGSVEVAAVADDSRVQSSRCRNRHLKLESKEKGVLPSAQSQRSVILSLLALEDFESLQIQSTHSYVAAAHVPQICICLQESHLLGCSHTAEPHMRNNFCNPPNKYNCLFLQMQSIRIWAKTQYSHRGTEPGCIL